MVAASVTLLASSSTPLKHTSGFAPSIVETKLSHGHSGCRTSDISPEPHEKLQMFCSVLDIYEVVHEITYRTWLTQQWLVSFQSANEEWVSQLTGQVPLEMMRSNDNVSGTPMGIMTGDLELRTDSEVSDIIEGVLGVVG